MRLLIYLLLVFGLFLCSDNVPVDRDEQAPLQTDQLVYRASNEEAGNRYKIEVVVSYTNHSDRPVYIGQCNRQQYSPIYSVVRADSATGPSAWNPVWACAAVPAVAIAPEETIKDTLILRAPTVVNRESESEQARTGTFRIVYDLYAGADSGNIVNRSSLLPREQSRSNPFEIRE